MHGYVPVLVSHCQAISTSTHLSCFLRQYVRSDMVRAAARFLEQRGGSVDLAAVQGWCRGGAQRVSICTPERNVEFKPFARFLFWIFPAFHSLNYASATCLQSDKLKSDLLVTCPGDGRGSATESADSFHPTPTASRARKSSLMEYDESVLCLL